MSARRVVLAEQAQLDLQDILRYTRERWGRDQQSRYSDTLYDAFKRIGRFPEIGPIRLDIRPAARSLRVGQHHVLYEIMADKIVIASIAHVHEKSTENLDE